MYSHSTPPAVHCRQTIVLRVLCHGKPAPNVRSPKCKLWGHVHSHLLGFLDAGLCLVEALELDKAPRKEDLDSKQRERGRKWRTTSLVLRPGQVTPGTVQRAATRE